MNAFSLTIVELVHPFFSFFMKSPSSFFSFSFFFLSPPPNSFLLSQFLSKHYSLPLPPLLSPKTGLSDVPKGPYTTQMMAADALSIVRTELGWKRCNKYILHFIFFPPPPIPFPLPSPPFLPFLPPLLLTLTYTKRFAVAGASMGGMITQHVGLQAGDEEVSHLLLLCTRAQSTFWSRLPSFYAITQMVRQNLTGNVN